MTGTIHERIFPLGLWPAPGKSRWQGRAVIVDPIANVVVGGSNRPAVLQLSKEDSLRAIGSDPEWEYFFFETPKGTQLTWLGTCQ